MNGPWHASYKGFLPLNQLLGPLCARTALLSPRTTLTARARMCVSCKLHPTARNPLAFIL